MPFSRTLRSSLLAALCALATACGDETPTTPAADASIADACAAPACVSADLVIGDAYRYQRVTPCTTLVHRLYNKAFNTTTSCSVTLAACGPAGLLAINEALADPEVVAALAHTSSLFFDASREGPWFTVLVGHAPWDGYFHPSEEGHHAILVQTICIESTCVPAPAGVLRLARVLEALGGLCDPLAPSAGAPMGTQLDDEASPRAPGEIVQIGSSIASPRQRRTSIQSSSTDHM
jgi:hypothetical protein